MKGRPAGASVRPTSSLTIAAHPLAAGDQMTGRGPFASGFGQSCVRRPPAETTCGCADRHALAADLGVRLVERLGQVGEQRHLFGGHSHVDSDAVRVEARRAGALAAVVAADAAAGRGGRGGGQRGRERGGTSPGGPPGGHRRATPCHRSLSAIIVVADGSPVPDGWVGCPFGSYVQGSSAVPRDSSRVPLRRPPLRPRPPLPGAR